jgi:hypothetical protein
MIQFYFDVELFVVKRQWEDLPMRTQAVHGQQPRRRRGRLASQG